MVYLKSEPRRLREAMSRLLLHIREKDIPIHRSDVAANIGISLRSVNNAENGEKVSSELILELFHFYYLSGRVTPAEFRLFFYLIFRLWRL